jgi:hypothetical protein
VRPPLDTRVLDPARLFKPEPETLHSVHAAVVRDIAAHYYTYPNPEYPHFRTVLNEPEVTQIVYTNYGRELTPDIVVLEWPERVVKILGEVATIDLLTPDNAREVWLPESRLEQVAFYLYIPAGYLKEAKLLLKEAGIKKKDVGLRTWRRIVGMHRPEIVPFS